MAHRHTSRVARSGRSLFLMLALPLTGTGQTSPPQTPAPNHAVVTNSSPANSGSDTDSCFVHRVTSLPGSHRFASDFIEAIASDPDPDASDPDVIWGLTADLSSEVPSQDRAMYISKSTNGGATWTQIARVDSRYFDARIGEGLRNGFIVSPGGTYFVITTQRGAFQVFPQPNKSDSLVKPIVGPRVPDSPPKTPITKKAGDPIRANVVELTADGNHLIIGYGYFDREPQLFRYHKDKDESWIEEGPILHLPTKMDLLSAQFDDSKKLDPGFLYVGTGDQVYLLNLHSMKWSRIEGVGPDSAIHGMSVVGGLHLAACWGVYNPSGPGTVRRVTNARFLLHRTTDETGSNVRAYSIEVDPSKPNREVVTSLTGVYTSQDSGESWRRLNDLPEEEFRSAHFNSDGTILVSGIAGTFLANPFSDACSPHLKIRQ
ncbi:WD40/YVTN/BNR-like repeat-containing protein [Tunturiibacter gelidoferens]|uniref:Exo-alpha-sialidase n=1 Tax=Tunturiibacter gelidiferens TaxID=3069689 RepID=A0AAU7YXG7_9BACT